MAGCTISMPDGTSDKWGYGYLKSVYKDRGSFRMAIATLTKVIQNLERYQGRLSPIASEVEGLWDDYWCTERLVGGFETCVKDYEETITKLKIARDNLQRLVDATEYCAAHGWGEKSTGSKVADGVSAVLSLGTSGSLDSANNMSFSG